MSEAESLKGQFLGFTAEQRSVRLSQFIDVIVAHNLWEVSLAVPDKAYNEVLYPLLPPGQTSPYYSAFLAMVTACSGIYRHTGSPEIVDFIFDRQDGMHTKLARRYSSFKTWFPKWQLGRIAFADDKKVLPLQAADLIAWQTRRFMCTQEATRDELRRLHSLRQPFRKTIKQADLQDMADAIVKNIPNLRQEKGEEKVDKLLAAIARRNHRADSTKRRAQLQS